MAHKGTLIVAIRAEDIPAGFKWPQPSLCFAVVDDPIDALAAIKGSLGLNVVECVQRLRSADVNATSHPVATAIAALRTGAPYIGGDRH